jgi:hypothetical protein
VLKMNSCGRGPKRQLHLLTTNIEEKGLFDGVPRDSQALTIDAGPARSDRQMLGLTQNYLDYKYEFRNNS